MNKSLLFIAFFASCGLLGNSAMAKPSAKLDVKCHLELYGGKDVVHFFVVKDDDLRKLTASLVGSEIKTSRKTSSHKVYQVKECVLLSEDFKTSQAQGLDKLTAR